MAQAATTTDVGARARRHIARRIIPFLFISYIIAYLDRVNVGYAALEMKAALGFTDAVFGMGAGIFFIGYFLLEIPGALIVERWSARRWFARIMISWGMVTILTAFIRGKWDFYGARVLLGCAEAGFFPGIIVYLTHWFRYEDRAKAVAGFMAAIALSNVFGSPLAGWLLGINWFGIEGWRWLFIVEGIPAVVMGLVTLVYLTDWPRQALWLPEDERRWITEELEREKQAKKAVRSYTVWQAFRNRDVLLLALLYFLGVTGHYGFILWQPTILKRASGLPNLTVTVLASLPFLTGVIAMWVVGWHSDRTGERRWHTALPLLICAGAFLANLGVGSHFWATVVLFALVGACLHAYLPGFWSLPTIALSDSAAAASIGLINSVGNLGGFAGPAVVGYLSTRTHSFAAGILFLLTCLLVSGVLVLQLRVYRAPDASGRDH
jgi:ACS family tartrate transporter-like MFS transporter